MIKGLVHNAEGLPFILQEVKGPGRALGSDHTQKRAPISRKLLSYALWVLTGDELGAPPHTLAALLLGAGLGRAQRTVNPGWSC